MKSLLAPSPSPIVVRTLAEEIAEHLEADIITRAYPPGRRLVERELSQRFQVSSIPIREALQRLETRGLVMRKANRGCSVIQLSRAEVDKLNAVRDLLEPKVMEWAAANATPAGVQEISDICQRLIAAAEANDVARFFYEDLAFHRAIWEQSGNEFAVEILERVIGSLFACGLRDHQGIDFPRQAQKHERIVDAIRARKPKEASAALNAIVSDFRQHIEQNT